MGRTVKREQEIIDLRHRFLSVWKPFAEKHGLSFAGMTNSAEHAHYMAMGVMAFADEILQLDRPDNFGRLLDAMESDLAEGE